MTLLDFEKVKKSWEQWNIRGAVLASLTLQIILILSASSRKRTRSSIWFIWLAYLLADWVAAFAVGLISSGQGNDCPEKNSVNKNLAAFWAPFLLLHLGGPDNITAFSLEDNALWVRHLFGLIIQFLAVVYVFTQSASNDFWIPTVTLMVAGVIKYAERSRSLYLACLTNFKKSLLPKADAGPNYAQLMEEYSSMEAAQIPVQIEKVTETKKSPSIYDGLDDLNDIGIFYNAYLLYKTFRGLIVDHMFSFQDRHKSRSFFFKRKYDDAFRIMEVELNFIYDVLYTKSVMVHTKFWFSVRIFSSVLLAYSFLHFVHHHHNIHRFDLAVSYTLLIGALVLDFAGHVKLIFSDWTIVLTNNSELKSFVFAIHNKLSFGKRRRWSNKISQHSLMDCILREKFKWLMTVTKFVGLEDLIYVVRFGSSIPLENSLKELIFNEIRNKAKVAESIRTAKEICSARGEWILSNSTHYYSFPSISSSVSEEVEYDESLLLWHIATELCYYTSPHDDKENRGKCKWMSEYMLYLLMMQPTMMSQVTGILRIRFQDTCAEADKFFQRGETTSKASILSELGYCCIGCLGYICRNTKLFDPREESDSTDKRKDAFQKLLDVNMVVKPAEVKGDRSKSVLFDACMLAKDLNKLGDGQWEIMSKVWVELMCYAASHCGASGHADRLSKGGELITFIWLLMAHFGLGEQFRVEAGHVRAKLIVGK